MVDVVVGGGGNKASSVKPKLGAGIELGKLKNSKLLSVLSILLRTTDPPSSVSQILRSPPKYPFNYSTNHFFYISVTMGKVGPIYIWLEVSSLIDLLTSNWYSISISLPAGSNDLMMSSLESVLDSSSLDNLDDILPSHCK